MDDLASEFRITDAAIEKLHGKLARYKDRQFDTDEDLAEELEELLDKACYAVRRGTVNGKNPDILGIYDTEDGDYGREIYKLVFKDLQQDVTLIGVVTDDYSRRSRPGKVLITVLTFRDAMRSIKDGRWKNRDGTAINLDGMRPPPPPPPPPQPPEPASMPAPAYLVAKTPANSVLHGPFEPYVVTLGASVTQAVGDSGLTRTVKLGTDGKPLKGYRRGGTRQEREAFALTLLRKNPNIATMGRNGIHSQVKASFEGVGMRGSVVARLRAQVLAERGGVAPITTGLVPAFLGELMDGIKALFEADAGVGAAHARRGQAVTNLRALYARAMVPAPAPAPAQAPAAESPAAIAA
jgi:hypothetical protein